MTFKSGARGPDRWQRSGKSQSRTSVEKRRLGVSVIVMLSEIVESEFNNSVSKVPASKSFRSLRGVYELDPPWVEMDCRPSLGLVWARHYAPVGMFDLLSRS